MQQSPNQQPPSVMTILWADFPAFMAALFPFIVAILAMVVAFAGSMPDPRGGEDITQSDLPYLLGFGAILIVVCVPLLLYRVHRARRLLRGGHETPGTVTSARLSRNGSRLKYEFKHASKKYKQSVLIPFWIENIDEGDRVTVVLDPARPKRAIIKELYY